MRFHVQTNNSKDISFDLIECDEKPITQNTKDLPKVVHPEMMGDGTEEQNLNEKGNPVARIKKDEVDAAFEKQPLKKS